MLLRQLHLCFSVFKKACFGYVICTMMSSKGHYLLPISILYTTMLSKQSFICCNIAEVTLLVVVLLKQYYSSYNVIDSRCSSLKIIWSMLFVSENCHTNTVLLECYWCKVILYNVVLVILFPYVAESNSKLFMWMLLGTM